MLPIAVCAFALMLAAANAQTTQAMANFPWWCMRPNASESTGEIWAEMWLCRWNETFHISAPNASDRTIRSGAGQCLVGGSEGAFFDKCQEGEPLQKWEIAAAGVTAEKLATPDGGDSVVGQIALVSADANTSRPRMCLEGSYLGVEGTRVLIVPCDNVTPAYTYWMYVPPPPSKKVLLVMPARHAAGEEACVQLGVENYARISDCDDEDLVANWWVRDNDLIRMAAGRDCLGYNGNYAARGGCDPDNIDQKWSLGENGFLTLTAMPGDGCLTYNEEASQYTPGHFQMQPCTGDGKQTFAFLSAAPATYAIQVV